MAESFTVEAILSAVDKGFTKTMRDAESSMGGLDNNSQKTGTSIMDIAKGVGVFKLVDAGINMVKDSVGGAISRFDTLNNSTRSFENMGFTAQEVDNAMEALNKSISGLPTPLDSAISNVQLLSSSTNDLGKSEKIFAAMNNGILGFGGTTAQVDNAVIQLSQSFSNGKVDAQTWNSMINAGLGPTLSALGKTMGKTTGELKSGLSDGSISVEQFQDALIDLNKNGGGGLKSLEQIAKDATGGIGTGLANMKTAVTRGVANIVAAIDETLKEADLGSIGIVIGNIGSAFEKGLSKIAEYIPPVIKFVGELYQKIRPFLPLIGVVVGYIATYQAVMGTARKAAGAQKLMNAVMGANKIGLIISAITLLVGAIIYLWNTNEDFRNFVIDAWDAIKTAFSDAAEWVKNAWSGTKEFFSDLWKGITDGVDSGVKGVKDAWSDTKQWFSDLWTGIKGGATGIWDNVKEGADSAVKSIKDAWGDLKSKVSSYVSAISAPFEPLIGWFSGLWDSIATIAESGWEIIKSVIMGPVLLLIDLITGDFGQLKEDLFMIWDTIQTNATTIFNTIKDTVIGYVTALVDTVSNLWTVLKDTTTQKWNELKDWLKTTVENIVNDTIAKWESLKTGTINKFNETVASAKQTWENFKLWLLELVVTTISNVVKRWDKLKKDTVDKFNSLVDGAKQAWQDLKDSVSETVENVKNTFNKIKEIDLWEAGKAIMDSFFNGLKEKWEAVKDFVGGIGDWIRDHKGPISYDKRLLIPAGKAIMNGLNGGLMDGFGLVQDNVSGMADSLSDAFSGNIATPSLDGLDSLMNQSMSRTINAESELLVNNSKQPLNVNLNLGKRNYSAFVEDISSEQGLQVELTMQT